MSILSTFLKSSQGSSRRSNNISNQPFSIFKLAQDESSNIKINHKKGKNRITRNHSQNNIQNIPSSKNSTSQGWFPIEKSSNLSRKKSEIKIEPEEEVYEEENLYVTPKDKFQMLKEKSMANILKIIRYLITYFINYNKLQLNHRSNKIIIKLNQYNNH